MKCEVKQGTVWWPDAKTGAPTALPPFEYNADLLPKSPPSKNSLLWLSRIFLMTTLHGFMLWQYCVHDSGWILWQTTSSTRRSADLVVVYIDQLMRNSWQELPRTILLSIVYFLWKKYIEQAFYLSVILDTKHMIRRF